MQKPVRKYLNYIKQNLKIFLRLFTYIYFITKFNNVVIS